MRRAGVVVGALLVGLVHVSGVSADGDSSAVARANVLVGEQFGLVLEIDAPAPALVEIDSVAPSWAGVQVVRIDDRSFVEGRGHVLEVTAAGFAPGIDSFAPAVMIVEGVRVERRELPTASLSVTPSLPEQAALELSPLPDLRSTSGAQSPLLVPAIVIIAAAVLALVILLGRLGLRRLRTKREVPEPEPCVDHEPAANVLGVAEELLGVDPVRAYRLLGQAVRLELGRRYDFPAAALTTNELGARMENSGVDRWEARLVHGLLEECDSVVYAGYRPAHERLDADLNMAREILGEPG